MGHLYRFVEPVLLLMLAEKGRSYGYDLSNELSGYAFTDAEIERAALYKTLRRLEKYGYVTSGWDMQEPGPARRVYSLTASGRRHLKEWAQVLGNVAESMRRFIARTRALSAGRNVRGAGRPRRSRDRRTSARRVSRAEGTSR